MATADRYARSPGSIDWAVPGTFDTNFRWEYQDGRESLLKLYQKGKDRQWDATTRIDWSQNLDPENPEEIPDESIPIFGSPPFERLTDAEKANLRRHFQPWQLSQFLHGEQGALICTAKIVQQVPSMDAKFYAATQVIDEARHVAFGRFALRDYYPQLTQAERDEREEFAVEACYLMRDRFQAEEVWETLGLPVDECAAYMLESGFMQRYRSALFSRIVPIIKDIGLWGPKIQAGYGKMGILGYADTDVQAMSDQDEQVAKEYDARHAEIVKVAALA
jgi:hypothetical protein